MSRIYCVLLIVLSCAAPAQAQDTPAVRLRQQDVQLYLSNQRLGTYQKLANVGIWYGFPARAGRRLRAGVSYLRFEERGRPEFRPAGPDSIRSTRLYATANLAAAGVAVERERPISGRLSFYTGLEARAGYGTGQLDSTVAVERAPVGVVSWVTPQLVGSGIPFRLLIGQGRGCIGFRSSLRRWVVSLEAGGFANVLGQTYRNGQRGTDFTLGTDFRAAFGYRF